jgi:hypothetical protein
MTLCTESGAAPAAYPALSPDSYIPGNAGDCCPITTALPSVLPEHRVTALPGDNHQQASHISAMRLVRESLLNLGHVAIPVSNSDPPLDRFRPLRI